MLTLVLVVAIIVVIGTRASDGLQVKQQEVILANLPEPEALAYYEVLRRRVRKIAVLRAIALVSLVVMFYSYKHRLAAKAGPAKAVPAQTAPAPARP